MLETIKPTQPLLIEDLGMLLPKETSKQKRRFGIYKCSCGTEFKALTSDVKSGGTSSCGCYQKKRVAETKTTHGLRNHRLYTTWRNMIQRTTNPKNKDFAYYGGRNNCLR